MASPLFSKDSYFGASQAKGRACVCVSCGKRAHATQEISKYPFKYVPKGWSYGNDVNALWCDDCNGTSMDYAKTSVVFRRSNGKVVTIPASQLEKDWGLDHGQLTQLDPIEVGVSTTNHIEALEKTFARIEALEAKMDGSMSAIDRSIEGLDTAIGDTRKALAHSLTEISKLNAEVDAEANAAEAQAYEYMEQFFAWETSAGTRTFCFEGHPFLYDSRDIHEKTPLREDIGLVFEAFIKWVRAPQRTEQRRQLAEMLETMPLMTDHALRAMHRELLHVSKSGVERIANLFLVATSEFNEAELTVSIQGDELKPTLIDVIPKANWDDLQVAHKEKILWETLEAAVAGEGAAVRAEVCAHLDTWTPPEELNFPLFKTGLAAALAAVRGGYDTATDAWEAFDEEAKTKPVQRIVNTQQPQSIAQLVPVQIADVPSLPWEGIEGAVRSREVKRQQFAEAYGLTGALLTTAQQQATDALRRGAEKETTMTEKTPMDKQLDAIKTAGVLGAKLAITDQAGELFLDIAKELGDEIPAVKLMLESEDGREVVKLLMAILLQTMSIHTNFVPKAEMMQQVAGIQLTASSFKLLSGKLALIRKFIPKLTELGEQMEGLGVKARVETEEEAANQLTNEEIEVELAELKEKAAKE